MITQQPVATVTHLNFIPVRPLNQEERELVATVRRISRKHGKRIAYRSDQEILAFIEGMEGRDLSGDCHE